MKKHLGVGGGTAPPVHLGNLAALDTAFGLLIFGIWRSLSLDWSFLTEF